MMELIPLTKDNVFYNIREDKSIYLGIPTNIICVDDRLEPKALSYEALEYLSKKPKILIQDFTATLYLGKIIFKKNKQGNLAPIYLPSTITESSFEGLNTFWLNEINPKGKKPFISIMQCDYKGMEKNLYCEGSSKSIPYQKIHYYRSKDNIVLTKDQIISYFKELHTLNATFIKNHIDLINKEGGIMANHLHSELYKALLQQGVLSKDMVYIENTERIHGGSNAKLATLDYLKTTNHLNFTIAFFDELFYAYLAWSLKEYLIPYYHGRYQDEHQLLFNVGAYKQAGITKQSSSTIIQHPYKAEIPHKTHSYFMYAFYSNILPTKYAVGYIEGYELFYKQKGCLFLPRKDSPIPTECNTLISDWSKNELIQSSPNLPKSVGYKFSSPNKVRIKDAIDDELPPNFHTYTPSPLGRYYFELTDNPNTFIEYYQRIYPSIKNPPKGWNKEMMKKLELKLE